MDVNTNLCKSELFTDLHQFGDTDFYLQYDRGAEQYKVLDGSFDAFNTVITFPKAAHGIVQDLFNAYYTGLKQGEMRGEYTGRTQLQRELRALINE